MIFTSHFLYLLPNYYHLNALILMGRAQEEVVMRSSVLQVQVYMIAAELCWSAFGPRRVPGAACAIAAIATAALRGCHLAMAFSAAAGAYTHTLALSLEMAAGLCWIPVAQIGNEYTLQRRMSPARYRILAWLTGVMFAVATLLQSWMGCAWVAVPSVVLPACATAVLLLCTGPDAVASRAAGCAAAPTTAENVKQDASGDAEPAEGRDILQQRAALPHAAAFVGLGCVVGTTGEALMDMAIALAIRRSLQQGKNDLALTNQCAVFMSMLLAYVSETRSSLAAAAKARIFIASWMACQVFRGTALHFLESGGLGVPVLLLCAFVDKYTGPLGAAALDNALLTVLEFGAHRAHLSPRAVPNTLLWTARMVVQKAERPICQLILLHSSGFSVHRVAWLLTLVTTSAVLFICKQGKPRCPSKED